MLGLVPNSHPAAKLALHRARLASDWRVVVGGVCGLLLLALLWRYSSLPRSERLAAFIAGFDLAHENNFAVWWSAALMLVSAFNFAGFAAEQRAGLRLPWLMLAAMFALLSLDEVGSVHEREMHFSGAGQMLMLATALVFVATGLYSGLRLLLTPATRGLALLVGTAFVLYASVVLQEFIEHRTAWPDWARGMRAVVEEGSELLASGLVLFAIARQRAGQSASWSALLPRLDRLRLRIVLLGLLGVHLAFSLFYIGTLSDLGPRGNPAHWYLCLVYLLIACRLVAADTLPAAHSRIEAADTLPRVHSQPAAGALPAARWWLAAAALLCSLVAVFNTSRWWPLRALPLDQLQSMAAATLLLLVLSTALLPRTPRHWSIAALLLATTLAALAAPVLGTALALLGISAYLAAELLTPPAIAQAQP